MEASITRDNSVFAVVSFEGPDVYCQAGGLGARVTNLCETLAHLDFSTHLFYVGDPAKTGEESTFGGKLTLHRWCQSISARCPVGVYQGENEKLNDLNDSLPDYLVSHVVAPAARQGKVAVILGEEWQTAEAMCRLGDRLAMCGLTDNALIFWNANNTFGFEHIDWDHLGRVSTLTTVSRYMKLIMQGLGLDPLIIPNGIPSALLNEVDSGTCDALRTDLGAEVVLTKIARWDPSKRWDAALEATARLKASGLNVKLLARGGSESYGEEVAYRARTLGLRMRDVGTEGQVMDSYDSTVVHIDSADVLNLKCFCPQSFLRILYHASDAVLANSSHEPFGLVGLETIAAGGVAYTGGTGEDYAIPFRNSIVLETSDPQEIETYVRFLKGHPASAERIRKAGRRTARQYTWEHVIDILVRKLEYAARAQGILSTPQTARVPESRRYDPPAMEKPAVEAESPVMAAENGSPVSKRGFTEVYEIVKKIKREAKLKDRANRFLSDVPWDRIFYNRDGRVFRNIQELETGLATMTDDTFAYHSNNQKRDFSQWIRDVIGDEKLATSLERAQNRIQAATVLAQRVALLRFRLALT